MADLALTAAVITGTVVMIPTVHRYVPRRLDHKEVLCRTGTRLVSEAERSALALKLVRAGLKLSPEYFAGIRAAITGAYLFLCLILLLFKPGLAVLIALVPIIFILPSFWLKRAVEKRQNRIRSEMADFTIMMATALTAGINPIPALQEASSAVGGVLQEEVNSFIMEIMSGKNFSIAVMELVMRNDVDELANFCRTIEQIYIQGAPGAETMKIYSEQMRISRKFETMDRAGQLSVQLIFPVLLFILLPILMAIGYPSVYALLHAF